ncbi:hypothetical protein AOLI_G00031770, partial [Acnodon oligacanthus]
MQRTSLQGPPLAGPLCQGPVVREQSLRGQPTQIQSNRSLPHQEITVLLSVTGDIVPSPKRQPILANEATVKRPGGKRKRCIGQGSRASMNISASKAK